MYKIKKVGLFDFSGQIRVNSILYNCGKDMAKKYDLHHWDNSHFKNFIIVVLCVLKNSVYLVSEEDNFVATFQTRKVGEMFRFENLHVCQRCRVRVLVCIVLILLRKWL